MTPGIGEETGSVLGMPCMSTTLLWGTALPSLRTKLSVEVAVRREAGGALREVASQER